MRHWCVKTQTKDTEKTRVHLLQKHNKTKWVKACIYNSAKNVQGLKAQYYLKKIIILGWTEYRIKSIIFP